MYNVVFAVTCVMITTFKLINLSITSQHVFFIEKRKKLNKLLKFKMFKKQNKTKKLKKLR